MLHRLPGRAGAAGAQSAAAGTAAVAWAPCLPACVVDDSLQLCAVLVDRRDRLQAGSHARWRVDGCLQRCWSAAGALVVLVKACTAVRKCKPRGERPRLAPLLAAAAAAACRLPLEVHRHQAWSTDMLACCLAVRLDLRFIKEQSTQ